jgi:hypothetical protein
MRAESEWEEHELGKLEDEFAVGRVPQITAPLPFTCPGLKKAARIKRLRAERCEQLKMAKENPEINRASLPGIPPPKPKSIRGEKRRKSTEHLPKPEQQQSI